MQCMKNWQSCKQCATDKRRPIEGVGVNDVKFILPLLQFQEESQKEVSLCEEATIRGTFSFRSRKICRLHGFWYLQGFNRYTTHKGILATEQCYCMSALD